jgi:hypothetical protein
MGGEAGDWGWIAFGYAVVYGVIVAYAGALAWRLRAARRRLGARE